MSAPIPWMLVLIFLIRIAGADLTVAQEPNPKGDPQVHEGMVVSATASQVSLRNADGKEQVFKANAMTRVTVHGKPGKLDELKAGMLIRVMVDGKGMVTSIATVDDRKGK